MARLNDRTIDNRGRCMRAIACLVATASLLRAASAQVSSDPRTEGIAVQGLGERAAKPNQVELELRIAGSAEIFGDALVKFRDVKRRTLEAYQALGLKNLTVRERGIALARGDSQEAMQMAMRGQVTEGVKFKVELSSNLRVQLTDVAEMPPEQVMETLGKLLDTARDSGADVGPSAAQINMAYRYGQQITGSISRFVLQDFEAAREEAYKAAVADARARAERLASLSGVKLGRILSVSELNVSGDEITQHSQPYYPNQQVSAGEPRRGLRIESDTFTDIPIRVRLMVRFAIDEPDTVTAQSSN
jgi:uncharacterized protein YggE